MVVWCRRRIWRLGRECRQAASAACAGAALLLLTLLAIPFPMLRAQVVDRIVSEHVRIRVPAEREWLGQDTIMDLERCYLFIHRLTNKSLPRRVLVTATWSGQATQLDGEEAHLTVGMSGAAAAPDSRAYLLHHAAREMARLALLRLSDGVAGQSENRFLLEGMTEIIAREFGGSSRSLGVAWTRCRLLDRMESLSFSALASWERFSAGRPDMRAASPGITLLTVGRGLRGRESLVKLFETLRKKALARSLADAFKIPAGRLEKIWLERIRGHQPEESLTVTAEADAPDLDRVAVEPATAKPGVTRRIDAFIRDRTNDLPPEGVFLEDRLSRRVTQARTVADGAMKRFTFEVPVESDRRPGSYEFLLTAIDEAGNLRTWPGTYAVEPD